MPGSDRLTARGRSNRSVRSDRSHNLDVYTPADTRLTTSPLPAPRRAKDIGRRPRCYRPATNLVGSSPSRVDSPMLENLAAGDPRAPPFSSDFPGTSSGGGARASHGIRLAQPNVRQRKHAPGRLNRKGSNNDEYAGGLRALTA